MPYPLTDYANNYVITSFFKWLPLSECQGESGDLDSVFGLFALVLVDEDLVDYYVDECPDAELALRAVMANPTMDVLPFGLYLVTWDSNGLVWAERNEDDILTRVEFHKKTEAYNLSVNAEG